VDRYKKWRSASLRKRLHLVENFFFLIHNLVIVIKSSSICFSFFNYKSMLYNLGVAVNVCNCRNDHEIIQLFLSRGHVIDHPHPIYCKCADCELKQNTDSLKRSLSRLNTYKALSSPAFMALSSVDPITATFELRQEMMQVAQVEKEFKVSRGQDVLKVLCASFLWLWTA